jgi:hypothetical protein
MKRKILTILLFSAMLIAACAPAPIAEEADVLVEDEAMEAEDDAAMEDADADADAAMEEESDEADDSVMEGEVSFSADIWPVLLQFAPHSSEAGKAGVFFRDYDELMEWVVPGDPEGSRLYQVLTATGGAPQMPPSGPLPAETIQLFYDWIMQGAKNN